MAKDEARYINRELSWLEFNQRVLDEARNDDVPLLERLKFLAITGSNLDEFFMVRVGGLDMLSKQGNTRREASGMTPDEQLAAITERTQQMSRDQYACYLRELEPRLAAEGIRRRRPSELTNRQAEVTHKVFESEIFPVLTPMAIASVDEFPLLINNTLNVCVRLEGTPQTEQRSRYAIIPFGRNPHRFITLPSDGGYEYILLEDVVSTHIDRFFPGEHVLECVPFRLTRNADLSVREDLAADLLAEMENVLDARKQADCIRLKLAEPVSPELRAFLCEALGVGQQYVYAVPGPLDLSAFMRLAQIKGFEPLRYKDWSPQPSPEIDPKTSMFEVLSRQDVLLYHPFESFEPVVRLIEEAADDPDVIAIKQILYRTSRDSPIVAALARAAEHGKHVTALVELKARFDEARNIEWAKSLEQADVQVIYGVKNLKTHAKVCLIVRREPHGIQRYVHFGTGNYNESTARLYTDASYMTTNEELAADATAFLNAITGYSQPQRFRKIEAAPIGLRETLIEMIELETQRCKQGHDARIMAKMNSLVDPKIIEKLYDASRAGVKIRLNVRGICCLRPGVPKLSENIRVISIVDRFLEHSRIFYFHHGADPRVFIASADWMPRNLDRRVELMTPVEDPTCRDRLIDILEHCFADNVKARRLRPDGSYERVTPSDGQPPLRSQEALCQKAYEAIKNAEQSRRTIFEPHRAAEHQR